MNNNWAETLWRDIQAIHKQSPLIHNITNYVVMRVTADALLALGASPAMSHAREEVSEMAGIASALVLNIGTLSPAWVEAMHLAINKAKERNIPIILDPVAAGATSFRDQTLKDLINNGPLTIIKGNASEIAALAKQENIASKGVDSVLSSEQALESAKKLAATTKSVIAISGKRDYIVKPNKVVYCDNGHSMMARVTGTGCSLAAFMGAFAAVNDDAFEAATHGVLLSGIVGEMAAEKSTGPGQFRSQLLDQIYNIDLASIESTINIHDS